MISLLSTPFGLERQPIPLESTILMIVAPLTQLLEDCSASSVTIKKMLHSRLGSTINRILELLPYMIKYQGVCEVQLGLLHSVFSVPQQLVPAFTQNVVQGLLHIHTRCIT